MVECIRCKELIKDYYYKRHHRNCVKRKECPECKTILSDFKYDSHVRRCNKEFICKGCNIIHNGKYYNLDFCSKFCGRSFSRKSKEQKTLTLINCLNCNTAIFIDYERKIKYYCKNCKKPKIKNKILKNKIVENKICINCNVNKPKKYYKLCEDCKKIKYSEYEIYKKSCLFTHNINKFPNEYDFDLIKKYGWYKVTKNKEENNLKGVSRDHIYSISEGFKNNINPNIIKHPANCRLIRHNENQSKGFKCNITIEELIQKIEEWNKKYNTSSYGRDG
jgi:hypothetical protein